MTGMDLRSTTIMPRHLGAWVLMCTAALGASRGHTEEVHQEEVAQPEQFGPSITYSNAGNASLTRIKLLTRALEGRPGSIGSGKIGPGHSGDITLTNTGSLTLIDQPGVIRLESNAPDSIKGSASYNYSAQPGLAGTIRFTNRGTLSRTSGAGEDGSFAVELQTRQGNWTVANPSTGGYTNKDVDNPDALRTMSGANGSEVFVSFDAGALKVANGSGLLARSIGGLGAGPNALMLSATNRFFEPGAGGLVDFQINQATIETSGTALQGESRGAETISANNMDVRAAGNGGPVKVVVGAGSQIKTTGAGAHALLMESLGGDASDLGGANRSWLIGVPDTVGTGGSGGDVNVELKAASSIITLGEQAHAVFAQSSGGGGANGFTDVGIFAAQGRDGGSAGSGGSVTVRNSGLIETSGDQAYGVLVGGVGGGKLNGDNSTIQMSGGEGGSAVAFGLFLSAAHGGEGGGGGNGPSLNVEQGGRITTNGAYARGVSAVSIGGNGGDGGSSQTYTVSTGVLTEGVSVNLSVSQGGAGGFGGNGGAINFGGLEAGLEAGVTRPRVETFGDGAAPLSLVSIGGGGGAGGDSVVVGANAVSQYEVTLNSSVGGSGGKGGSGGALTVNNTSDLIAHGANSRGIDAMSVGGGGGVGGMGVSAFLDIYGAQEDAGGVVQLVGAVGGRGGEGGGGGAVTITNSSANQIETQGADSSGVSALSVGGGGGRGGDAVAAGAYVANNKGNTLSANYAVGGQGGAGGHGGRVSVINHGQINAGRTEAGNYSFGVSAQSIGGGGGNGGMASAVHVDLVRYAMTIFEPELAETYRKADSGADAGRANALRVDIAVGGSGGAGGDADQVEVTNTGGVSTWGRDSAAVFAQSVGGGGGIGLAPYTDQIINKSLRGEVNLGGAGGAAGHGGPVTVTNSGSLVTKAAGSPAVFAQSVGGGGGAAGSKDSEAFDLSGVMGVVHDIKALATGAKYAKKGANSIYGSKNAVAPAGGGGDGGGGSSKKLDWSKLKPEKVTQVTGTLRFSSGGKGGAAGDGGDVTVRSNGHVSTSGGQSVGVFAQSVGGGGGSGGLGQVRSRTGEELMEAVDLYKGRLDLGADVAIGGDGGASGHGGAVQADIESSVSTLGRNSAGVFLQSVGGGGGVGGAAIDAKHALLRASWRVGGDGGASGNGGDVSVNLGSAVGQTFVTTVADNSPGLRLQSVGGGGGLANVMDVDAYENLAALRPEANTVEEMLTVLGAVAPKEEEGSSNKLVSNGDSGDGGVVEWAKQAYDDLYKEGYKKQGLALVTVGGGKSGDGSSAGDGGEVTAMMQNARVVTQGHASQGVSLWSIGGGGGSATPLSKDELLVVGHVEAGLDGANGHGGAIKVDLDNTSISTSGEAAHGLQAQSIGGGGGHNGRADVLLLRTAHDAGLVLTPPAGDGGDITITSDNSPSIATSGAHSHGMFLASSGSGFTTMTHGDRLVVTTPSVRDGGRAGHIDLTYSGRIAASGEGANGVLAVAAGTQGDASRISLKFDRAQVSGGRGQGAAALGIIGQNTKYAVKLSNGASVGSPDGFAIATTVACASCEVKPSYGWKEIKGEGDNFNLVQLSDRSVLSGNVRLSGPSLLKLEGGSKWYPGSRSVIGGGAEVLTSAAWDQPLTFVSADDGADRISTNFGVDWGVNVGNKAQGSVVFSDATLNPGGPERVMHSEIITGGDAYGTHVLLAKGSALEIDVGHDGSGPVSDRVVVNPTGSGSNGSLMSGNASEGGGYDLKIRVLNSRDIVGKTFTVAEARSVRPPERLLSPLAMQASYSLTRAPAASQVDQQRQGLKVAIQGVRYDTGSQLSGIARAVAKQMDEGSRVGHLQLDQARLRALRFYPGQETAYAQQMEELARTGNLFDVTGRWFKGLLMQNQLHSCQTFVGQGLGLVEEECNYARVIESSMTLAGAQDALSQGIDGSAWALGAQRRLGDGLVLGGLIGFGQSQGASTDGDYHSSADKVTVGAVLKKGVGQQFGIALSGTYAEGAHRTARTLNSSLVDPVTLTSHNRYQTMGLRLRLAHYGANDTFYFKPHVDFDARYHRARGFTEQGDSAFALIHPRLSYSTFTATPRLELGSRINTDRGVWRTHFSAGAVLSNDKPRQVDLDFAATPGGTPLTMSWEATPRVGVLGLGAEFVAKDRSFFSIRYEQMAGDGVRRKTLTARMGWRF